MFTVTGKIEDATGKTLHATIHFLSKSTPLGAGGIITTNTDKKIMSNATDGTFTAPLNSGNYTVNITAQGQATSINITVPPGTGTGTIDTLITTPLAFPFGAEFQTWDGQWPGNITFLPTAPPPRPGLATVAYAGGNINVATAAHYSYWVSYVTATGQTVVSPQLATESGEVSVPDQANRILLTTNPTGVTSVNIWRTFTDNGHTYHQEIFPQNVALLATVSPSASYYDDWESPAQFAGRATAEVPPLFNTTAGQLLSSNETVCAYVTDQGLFFPGSNCRIVEGFGLQIYNFTTELWHTLLNAGSPAVMAMDGGNPN